MPFNTTPEIDFAAIGLITDVPPHNLPPGSWSDCLDIRCKDGSVQGVFKFEDSNIALHDTNTVISGGTVEAITQFNEAGSDDLIIAYIVKGTDSNGYVLIYDTVSGTYNDITSTVTDHVFTFSSKHKPQLFVFNGCLIVNPATDAPPMWSAAALGASSLEALPDWFDDVYVDAVQEVQTITISLQEVQTITISGTPVVGTYTAFLSHPDYSDIDLVVATGDTADDVIVSLVTTINTLAGETIAVAYSGYLVITFPESLGDVEQITYTVGSSGMTVSVVSTPIPDTYIDFVTQTDNGSTDLSIAGTDTLNNIAASLANAIGDTAISVENQVIVAFPYGLGPVDEYTSDVGSSGLTVTITTDVEGILGLGTPIVARTIRPFNNRLIAMNIKEERDPSTLSDDVTLPIDFLWSGSIKAQGTLIGLEWATSSINTAGDSFLTQTPGKIVDGMQLGPYFIAYKEDAVIQVYETNNTFVLGFRSIFEDDGIFSSGCVASIGSSQHVVVGNYGVYIHDGQSQKVHIAKGVFQEFLYASINPNHKDRSFIFQQTRDKEVWFCYSSIGNTGGGCDGAFAYDYETQKLHRRSLPNVSSLYETELDGILEIYGASEDGIITLSDSLYESGGFFIRRNENLQNNDFKTLAGCSVKAEGKLRVSTSANKNINDVEVFQDTDFDPDSSHKVSFRENGRYLSLKITMLDDNNIAINPKLTTLAFDFKLTSRR